MALRLAGLQQQPPPLQQRRRRETKKSLTTHAAFRQPPDGHVLPHDQADGGVRPPLFRPPISHRCAAALCLHGEIRHGGMAEAPGGQRIMDPRSRLRGRPA